MIEASCTSDLTLLTYQNKFESESPQRVSKQGVLVSAVFW